MIKGIVFSVDPVGVVIGVALLLAILALLFEEMVDGSPEEEDDSEQKSMVF